MIGAICYLIIVMLFCIFLIFYIKIKEKHFIKFLDKYSKDNFVECDYHFYILNLYISLYVWEKPVNSWADYLKLLEKYGVVNYERKRFEEQL